MRSATSGTQRARRSGYLRPEPSPFFGRDAELAALDGPLVFDPLVTIAGPAGIGKTRLALRYGTTRRASWATVWFCDMSDARGVEEMTQLLLRTLAVHDAPPASAADATTALARALAARTGALVILDHLEHLLPAAAVAVRRWIAAAPDVRFIATSRVPLGVDGEHVITLGAMGVPPPGEVRGDAVDLFVDRVRARDVGWAPARADLASIAELVRRLDGVPLAIELAAARAGDEDPGALLERAGDAAGSPLERAFALLPKPTRDALAQCAVFRGSFSLQAAEQVVHVAGAAAGDLIVDLARRNLLQVERFQPIRFSMCEGIRALAQGEERRSDAVRARHAEHFVGRAIAIDGPAPPTDAADDWDDLLAAMAFGAETGRPDVVLRVAIALDGLAQGAGLGSSELSALEAALRLGGAANVALLGRALGVRARALHALGRLEDAKGDAEDALRLATELGDRREMGAMMRVAAEAHFQLGDFDAAAAHLVRALDIERERGDVKALATVHRQLGDLASSRGDAKAARRELETSLSLSRTGAHPAGEARALMGLAWQCFEGGDRDGAVVHYRRALDLLRALRMVRSERIVDGYLGVLHFEAGDLGRAEEHLARAAFASRQAGDFRVEGVFEGVRGAVLASLDCLEEARASFALAEQLLVGNSFYGRIIAIHRGHLDLAEARGVEPAEAAAHVDRARARAAEARAAGANGAAIIARSDDARVALRVLERALGLAN